MWRNRVVGYTEVPPDQLTAHPQNARWHPPRQAETMRDVLDHVGWITPVIENVRTGYVVDGHLRLAEALSAGMARIPVIQVDLDEAEEAEALITHDAVGQLARWEKDRLDDLAATLDVEGPVGKLVEDITASAVTLSPGMPDLGADDEILGDMRSLCAVYPVEQYRLVVEDLERIPGDSFGAKVTWLMAHQR